MTTRQFIDFLAAGESAAAKETLENVISAKAFETLDAYKQELASGIFNGGKTEEVESEEEVEVQEVE
jgi:hypothetical protein